ncbi:hypothetical protein [Leptospira sp. GIMC2001]|uniref:hypothetical protein n=1 Tax=Leptospira sp. GIMC2001 TaxID=1513297 RepID=UPI00234B6375|nr:hypothetical protein [Leptospira sp. GIMC2001]WCL48573.1 hypothetical protein O4O04_14860 [Leptospira sp. GIMC2001]
MIQLNYFEILLRDEFDLSDRDARRMDRAVHDIAHSVGMEKREVFDFIKFGCESDMKKLNENYDWKDFHRSIVLRLKKQF